MRRKRLIAARKAVGLSQEQVGHEAGVDRTTIGTWERGEYTPQPHQRGPYAAALAISLEELDGILSDLPAAAGTTPVWLAQYLNSEQSAEEIISHEPHVIHGLLQTPAYAAAIAQSVGVTQTSPAYIDRNVSQREHRQGRLDRGAVELNVIHSEMALHLKLGTSAEMAAQLHHLVELGRRDNVTIQVVPFTVGQYEALRVGAISAMTHPWTHGPSVFIRRYGGTVQIEDSDEAANFVAVLTHAASVALPPDESLAFIARAAEQWEIANDD